MTPPLATALEATGTRPLPHGDLRDDNLGLTEEAVVLLDWDLATAGTPTVEFAWYLCHDAWRIDAGHDEIEADFRAAEGDLFRARSRARDAHRARPVRLDLRALPPIHQIPTRRRGLRPSSTGGFLAPEALKRAGGMPR